MPIPTDCHQKVLSLVRREVCGIPTLDGWTLDHRRGIPPEQPVPNRDVERCAQDGVDGPHGGRREAGRALGHDERLDVGGTDPVEGTAAQDRDEVLAGDVRVEVDR
jgi:hypothetical protein